MPGALGAGAVAAGAFAVGAAAGGVVVGAAAFVVVFLAMPATLRQYGLSTLPVFAFAFFGTIQPHSVLPLQLVSLRPLHGDGAAAVFFAGGVVATGALATGAAGVVAAGGVIGLAAGAGVVAGACCACAVIANSPSATVAADRPSPQLENFFTAVVSHWLVPDMSI